nr:hypothetical protein [Moritella sp. F3]
MEALTQLDALKFQYLDSTTEPLDGMWLCGFLPMATHYGFYISAGTNFAARSCSRFYIPRH